MPRIDWTTAEVEATVSSYLDMLNRELRGDPVNKSEARRALLALLNNRSPGAVELKHQNISAVLIENGMPYIDGYKPRHNYQQLLADVVLDRLGDSKGLTNSVQESISQPVEVPTVGDILSILVDPPKPLKELTKLYDRRRRPQRTNYLQVEAQRASIGRAGEALALNYERARLSSLGKESLAERVEQVSVTRGDGDGFDIQSFEASGRDRLIEVKTTAYGKETPFFASQNEVQVSADHAGVYHLYRVYWIRRDPKLYCLSGSLRETCLLEAVTYRGRVA